MSLFEISKTVGTVLQDSDGQFVGLTVAEDIAFALENECVEEPELHGKVLEAAKRVNLEKVLDNAPGELSGGQKQRVSIAGIMVDNVDVFLFDEPLANLDPATGKRAIELIDEIQKQTGAAVIIIEHRIEDVLWRHVDRVVLMNEGRILSNSSADELLSSNLLIKNGIREPLYITALKYAGVEIKPSMHPWSINEIELSTDDREKVRLWYEKAERKEEDDSRPVLLKCEGLEFAYANGHNAVDNISAYVKRGEIMAIAGTNGAGKTSFAKLICGFEKQQSGKITFDGIDLDSLSIKERADRIGYVMQNPNQMISKVMIRDEVALGLVTRGAAEDDIDKKVDDALKVCGLYDMRNWPVSALSYGQKKRVTIASILVLEPDMIILDEPTAGQDYAHYTDIMEFISSLNARGISIMLITHDMHLMLEYAERAIVFDSGKAVADAPCADILTDDSVTQKASLKRTSLYDLASMCDIDSPRDFVSRFISYEKAVRGL